MTKLSVTLENIHEPILSGDILRGCVILKAKSLVSGRKIETVLKGEEQTTVFLGDNQVANQTNCFLQVPVVLRNQIDLSTGKIKAGDYLFPFEVMIPDRMPSSMKQANTGSDKCEVVYYISTRILGSGVIYNYHAKAEFQVMARQYTRIDVTPVCGGPVSEKVTAYCCFNRGHVTIGARLEDVTLGKLDTIKVYLAARNNSTVPIRRVCVELLEITSWHAERHKSQAIRSLGVVVQLPLFAELQPKMPYELPGNLAAADEVDVQMEVQRGLHSILFKVPKDANDTFEGQLLTCHHMVRIRLETGFCVTHPVVMIPVTIVPWKRIVLVATTCDDDET